MHPQVRHARFNLVVCSITLVLTITAYIVLLGTLGPQRARGAFGFFGFLGLLGLGPTFYHKKQGAPGVVLDERDKQIGDRSQVLAFRAVWLFWCLACIGPWLGVALRSGLKALEAPFVRPESLPWVLMGAFVVFNMAWSLSILHGYRHEERAGNE